MKKILKYTLLLALLLPISATAQETKKSKEERRAEKQLAQAEKERAKQEEWEKKHAPSEADVVYIFGVGTNFNDSTVYLSEVLPVTHLRLTKKYKFLPYRADFSQQFKDYLMEHYGVQHETTCVFYAAKRSKTSKRFYKMKKRYLDMGTSNLIVVPADSFKFTKPDYDNVAF